jgi:hypothetical protein
MTYRHPEFAYPASRLRDLHPLHRLRSVRPGQQRFPNPWPLLPQVPGPLLYGHSVDTRAAFVPLHAPECGEEIPSFHDAFHQALFANRSVRSRCSNRRFTPPLREGQLQLRHRCPASVQHPVNPPADRSGLQPAPAGLVCPLLTSACRWARIPPRSVPLIGDQPAALPG